jgi:pimeloyl-ACP methyl ester carboxylesterase
MTTQTKHQDVQVLLGRVALEGMLAVPADAAGLVLFAHGSGSSRFSRRNQFVAEALNDAGLATLLFDLLTIEESRVDDVTREWRFNINLLAERVVGAVDWCGNHDDTRGFRLGLFGASTGAAAALVAAAQRPEAVGAVVSRGGRPDLAGDALPEVEAPTLLIVGGDDLQVIRLNREAAALLQAPHQLEIVPGATHLFEEPGTLEQVAELAGAWFRRHLE